MQPEPINNSPDQAHLHLLDKVDFSPIFIMGDHRSGTTALYQILVETGCFNYVKVMIKYVVNSNLISFIAVIKLKKKYCS